MKKRFSKQDILTIPNGMSLFRILLIPLIVWLYVGKARPYAAVAVVAVSGLTDIADGYIARHFNMVSDVGKILDPVADKLTQAALLICLATKYRVLYWVFALLCLKELTQGLLGLAAVKVTGEVQSARWFGKVSTGVFYGVVLVLLLFPGLSEVWAHVLIGLCAAALAMSMVLYLHHFLGLVWDDFFPEKSPRLFWARLLVIVLWAAVIVFCWTNRQYVTVDGILRISPQHTIPAIFLLLGLFAMKSLSVVLYSGILYAVSGILFPLPLAIVVNILGTAVMATIPYCIGRRLDSGVMERIAEHYKNVNTLRQFRLKNEFLFTLLIRAINILPLDIASVFLGAGNTRYLPYLTGTIGGMVASIVLFPIMGMNLSDYRSPQFIISAAAVLLIMLAGALGLRHMRKKQKLEEAAVTAEETLPAETEAISE